MDCKIIKCVDFDELNQCCSLKNCKYVSGDNNFNYEQLILNFEKSEKTDKERLKYAKNLLRQSIILNEELIKVNNDIDLLNDKLLIENEDLKSQVKKLTENNFIFIDNLKDQFEKNFSNMDLNKDAVGRYVHYDTRIKWISYYRCAVNNKVIEV